MTSKLTSFRLLTYGLLMLAITVIPTPRPGSTEAAAPMQPTLDLTLVIVGETEACRDHGYKGYLDGDSNCVKLTPEEVEAWKLTHPAFQDTNIPPLEIKLGARIQEALDTYLEQNPDTKEAVERESVVLLFKFNGLQRSPVSIERKADSQVTHIPDWKWEGVMDNEKRLIYHCRADAFHPGNNIVWILKAGGREWRLKTGG